MYMNAKKGIRLLKTTYTELIFIINDYVENYELYSGFFISYYLFRRKVENTKTKETSYEYKEDRD